jgi:O-methyltransferase involved in polyketide biosynthesis
MRWRQPGHAVAAARHAVTAARHAVAPAGRIALPTPPPSPDNQHNQWLCRPAAPCAERHVVTDNGPVPGGTDREPWPEINTEVAHVARVYDYLLGGKANFAVDRQAAERAYQSWPGGIDGVRADVRAHRALLGRVVTYLAGAGIRQFLDIGTGIPTENNTHQVAQRLAPEARIVYVDHDPIVLAHSHRLLTSTPEGATAYIFADLREPGAVLDKAAGTLDFSQPVAVMLFGVLHFFDPAEHPEQIIATLMGKLVPGSYLALTHLAGDVYGDQMAQTFRELNQRLNQTVVLRSQSEVAQLFDGLDLVEPGVVQLPHWRPGPTAQEQAPHPLPMWAAVGRKP